MGKQKQSVGRGVKMRQQEMRETVVPRKGMRSREFLRCLFFFFSKFADACDICLKAGRSLCMGKVEDFGKEASGRVRPRRHLEG